VDGYYWMTGRTKTIINVGAVKVFPHELESVLLSHSQVKEALVYGNPDARFGEVPQAKVVLHSGSHLHPRELMRYANSNLGVFKALRRLDIVHEIVKTPTGKIKRYESQED
jgi:oxalate---CoA ligase